MIISCQGCNHFSQSLTNSGPCYTFNGMPSSSIWKPSKLVDGFEKYVTNPQPLETYGGAGAAEGKLCLKYS